MQRLCAFANQTDGAFVHPVIRSIILHFMLAYDHPFVDGNGRTARALFYWSMRRHSYWMAEFISISHIVLKAPAKYGYAFLFTETDEGDLTYFILYHLKIITRALESLHEYIARKAAELERLELELRGIESLNGTQRLSAGAASARTSSTAPGAAGCGAFSRSPRHERSSTRPGTRESRTLWKSIAGATTCPMRRRAPISWTSRSGAFSRPVARGRSGSLRPSAS